MIVKEVNGEIFLNLGGRQYCHKDESIYSLRNSLVDSINKQIYKYFGLYERSDN